MLTDKLRKKIVSQIKQFKKMDKTIHCFVWDWESSAVYPYILGDYVLELQSI